MYIPPDPFAEMEARAKKAEAEVERLRKLCAEASDWFFSRSESFQRRARLSLFMKVRAAGRGVWK
jgi:hypothetical protein